MSAFKIPATITIGDTPSWVDTLIDYPASDGWALLYVLAGPATVSITETAGDGNNHNFDLIEATTAALTAGLYQWQSKVQRVVDGATQKRTLGSGQIEVLPNLEALAPEAVTEVLTINQQQLAACEEAIRRRLAGEEVDELIIKTANGQRSYKLPTLDVLYEIRTKLKAAVAREQGKNKRKVLIQFGPGFGRVPTISGGFLPWA